MQIKIPRSETEKIFQRVSRIRYGREVNFTPITEELSKLKKAGGLTYKHLNKISEKEIWPFHKWWRWPAKVQIDEYLKKTDGLFKVLGGLSKVHEEREEKEKKIIEILFYEIFKHLELVSIILRFIDEENYAIYSPPVAKIINSPRGYSYSSEYLNYLKELRKYRDIYNLKKVAYVDMFLWAIEVLGDEREGILDLFHRNIEKNTRARILNEIMKQEVFGKTDLEKAKFFLRAEAYASGAKWAGCAFEDIIRKKCRDNDIPLKKEDGKEKELSLLIEESFMFLKRGKEELKKIVKLRNKASHPSSYKFNSSEVKRMINITEELEFEN